MKIYIAGLEIHPEITQPDQSSYILCSYFYCRKNSITNGRFKNVPDIMLDSGAFTFMKSDGKSSGVDWNKYIEEYGEYVRDNKIKLYFELDIDHIVGLPEVERMRNRLEQIVGWKPIPVWHKSRGKTKFLESIKNYPYVALGGIAGRKWKPEEYPYFSWFINEAKKAGVKIHGLGFTRQDHLKRLKFDSVDSTSWASGGRYGSIYQFRSNRLTTMKTSHMKKKLICNPINIHNFGEWVKFQSYAKSNL